MRLRISTPAFSAKFCSRQYQRLWSSGCARPCLTLRSPIAISPPTAVAPVGRPSGRGTGRGAGVTCLQRDLAASQARWKYSSPPTSW